MQELNRGLRELLYSLLDPLNVIRDLLLYDSWDNLTEDKYLHGENSKNALVHFYCRTVVYCALRNSKEMKILYDWRGMPIEFIQQSQPAGSSSDTLFRLLMKYDGTGRRISKTVMHKVAGAADWDTAQVTHYTGIGTEIRENYAGPTKETKVVVKSLQGECRKNKLACSYDRAAAADAGGVNMPQGLGRYGIEDAENPDMGSGVGYIPNTKFEWYLKNHLGSTMLVYGTQADANPAHSDIGTPLAAYDYRAFGEMIELTPPPTGKVTENFTGKERDDEIALNYFGARYLDPMLGMWISVDSKRQFSSPYLYAGNGMNPVNVVDSDGNYAIWEHDVGNPEYHYYTFSYNGIGEHVIEWFANFIPGSGIVGIIPPKGLVEHSLHPSAAEGAFSVVFDVASNVVKYWANVASGVKLAFKYAGRAKMVYDGLQTLKQSPKLEDYMKDLTKGSRLLSSPDLDDLKKKADWATSYGANLYNQGVEITDEVRAKFHTDFQAEFAKDAKDDN